MTNSEKLKALVQKAVDNGLKAAPCNQETDQVKMILVDMQEHGHERWIFRHAFARALFGELPKIVREIHTNPFAQEGTPPDVLDTLPAWQAVLQGAVVSDAPIDYFYKEVFKDA